jgi:hypothetical protein
MAANRNLHLGMCARLAAVSIATAAIAQTGTGDINGYIAKAPIAGLPAGPYAKWTEAQKQDARSRIGGFCQFLCVDSFGNATFPNAQAAALGVAEIEVCLGACILNHLPPDYPELPALKRQLHVNFDKAKKLGSQIPWPLPDK